METVLHILTLEEAKATFGITDAQDDELLTRMMAGLQARFDSLLGRKLLRAAGVEQLFSGGGFYLELERFPVESVASIHVSDDQAWTDSALLDAAVYRVIAERGLIVLRGSVRFAFGTRNIRVVYTGGYVAAGTDPAAGQTALPDDIRSLFEIQLGYEWRNRKTLGLSAASAQGVSITAAPAKLLPVVVDGLAPYRRI